MTTEQPRDQRLVAKFRDYFRGEEPKGDYDYCLLHVTADQKRRLLAGDKELEVEVWVGLINMDIMRRGYGLTYDFIFLDEKDVIGRHRAWNLTL